MGLRKSLIIMTNYLSVNVSTVHRARKKWLKRFVLIKMIILFLNAMKNVKDIIIQRRKSAFNTKNIKTLSNRLSLLSNFIL